MNSANSSKWVVNVGSVERVVSAGAGAFLAAIGLHRRSTWGAVLAAAGAALVTRGVSGYCPINEAIGRDSSGPQTASRGITIRTSLTVDRPREEVYAHWRRLENLPEFMEHLSDVRQINATRSRWLARIPKSDVEIEWIAEITSDDEGRRLAWKSVESSAVANEGEVRLHDAPGGRGSEVHVAISYKPQAGTSAAKLLNPVFEQMVKEDIRRFKHVMEAGEIPSKAGQPMG